MPISRRIPCRVLLVSVIALIGSTGSATAETASQKTIENVLPRVVKIFGAGGLRNLYSYSTGFLVSADGHVATIWSHVINTDALRVVLDDGREFRAQVVGTEADLDLAVLKLQGENFDLPHFDLQKAATAGPGTRILGFSNMYKVAAGDEPASVLHGVIAARTPLSARRGAFEVSYDGPVYIIDAITNTPGSAGGVVTSHDGRLLGMIGKQLRNAESNTWVNYAIPIGALREPIEKMIRGEYVGGGKETAEESEADGGFQPIDFGLVMIPDVLQRTPAYIDSVLPGSPAAQAGLRAGDLIVFAGGELVQSQKRLAGSLRQLEAGDPLKLIVRRENELVTVELSAESGRQN